MHAKELKGNEYGKKQKYSYFQVMILEVPKYSTRTPLEVIKNVIKLSGYKIILKQSLAFLFTNSRNMVSSIDMHFWKTNMFTFWV